MSSATQIYRFLKIEMGEAIYAIDLAHVREIFPMVALERPPHLPSFVEGFINVDRSPLPVLRLERLLGMKDIEPSLHSHLISLKEVKDPAVLLVDRVMAITEVDSSHIVRVNSQQTFNACVAAQILDAEKIIYVLNLQHLLVENERKSLQEFQSIEEQRVKKSAKVAA